MPVSCSDGRNEKSTGRRPIMVRARGAGSDSGSERCYGSHGIVAVGGAVVGAGYEFYLGAEGEAYIAREWLELAQCGELHG